MKKAKIPSKLYMLLIFLFLYAPIAVLFVISFNENKSATTVEGFTLKWYAEVFKDSMLMDSLVNSLIIALLSALISTVLGTLTSIGIYNFKGAPRKLFQTVSNIPIINPEIVTGFSLLLLFTFVGTLFRFEMGFLTVLLAHIGFCTPYVILSVTPKLRQMDNHIYEAALDLGCNQLKAFFKVVLFELLPGIISGFLISFTYSLDDFVISYFTCGASFQTLPIYIFNNNRIPKKIPMFCALSVMLFLVIITILIIVNISSIKAEKKDK